MRKSPRLNPPPEVDSLKAGTKRKRSLRVEVTADGVPVAPALVQPAAVHEVVSPAPVDENIVEVPVAAAPAVIPPAQEVDNLVEVPVVEAPAGINNILQVRAAAAETAVVPAAQTVTECLIEVPAAAAAETAVGEAVKAGSSTAMKAKNLKGTPLLSEYMMHVRESDALKVVLSGLQEKIEKITAQHDKVNRQKQVVQDQLLAMDSLTVITQEDADAATLLEIAGYSGQINP